MRWMRKREMSSWSQVRGDPQIISWGQASAMVEQLAGTRSYRGSSRSGFIRRALLRTGGFLADPIIPPRMMCSRPLSIHHAEKHSPERLFCARMDSRQGDVAQQRWQHNHREEIVEPSRPANDRPYDRLSTGSRAWPLPGDPQDDARDKKERGGHGDEQRVQFLPGVEPSDTSHLAWEADQPSR